MRKGVSILRQELPRHGRRGMITRSCSTSPGWRLQERTDLTAVFLQSMRTEREGMHARADALVEVLGSDAFTERIDRRRGTIAAVDAGLLRRELFVAHTVL
jgi:hypothetical protein